MKVYLFFLKFDDVDEDLRPYIDRSYEEVIRGDIYYLFGFTNDGYIAKEFLSLYNKTYFSMAKVSMDELQFKQFDHDHAVNKLRYYKIDDKNKTIRVLLTGHQRSMIDDYFNGDVFVELCDLARFGYDFFNEEIVVALDALFYTFYFMMGSEDESDIEQADNNLSYGISACGYYSKIKSNPNEVNIFVKMYSTILAKTERNG